MSRILLIALAVVSAAGLSRGQDQPSAPDLARRLQARYTTIRSFTANFATDYQSALMPQIDRSSGTLKVLKPNQMWWTYDKPEKKHWVVDGRHLWDYDVRTKVAFRSPMPPPSELGGPLLFLAGRGDLTRDFTAAMAPAQPAGEWHLDLTPKDANAGFTSLTLMVTRDGLRLVGLKIVEPHATNTHRFTNLRENVSLTARDFELKLPSDVQIESR
jgi:outer membrane lipoprotein-sorting protein